jgi:hypothetical protein
MLNIGLLEKGSVAGFLQETFVPVAAPIHTRSCELMAFWQERPEDGIAVGRDIPSRRIASLLSHLILWAPLGKGKDYLVRHMGESLRSRFGGYVVGRKMSKLLSPEFFAYHIDTDRRLMEEDEALVLDIVQSHNGFDYLHYEVVMFPAVAPDGNGKWLVTGTFYF